MSLALPTMQVGEPLRHHALSVFPLFTEQRGADGVGGPRGNVANLALDYRLSSEALADGSLLVEEISEGGSVPELLVENQGDQRVLFLEGEELVGAKQNRILNTSVLVAAHSTLKVPVSCVEQSRWRYTSRSFGSSGSHSPSKLRRALKSSVTKSVREERGHQSDQGEVWKEVAGLHASHGVASKTAAMSDAFDSHQDRIAEFRAETPYVEGAMGAAVAIGDRVISIDIFDKPETCRKVWDRMLTGVVFDALEASADNVQGATRADVEALLATASDLPWQPAEAVGEGEEHRAESPRGDHASALSFEQVVVHGSVIAAN